MAVMKKSTRKKLSKQLNKLIKQHGAEMALALVTGIVGALASERANKPAKKSKKLESGSKAAKVAKPEKAPVEDRDRPQAFLTRAARARRDHGCQENLRPTSAGAQADRPQTAENRSGVRRVCRPPRPAMCVIPRFSGWPTRSRPMAGWCSRLPRPFGGTPVLFTALPVERVEPTPFQRDPSLPHVTRLMNVIETLGRFLDPIVVIRQEGAYWTPNGNHRLQALRKLGARTVTALLVPDPEIAFKILALNTEKAHNLKEKALETIRMERALAESARRAASSASSPSSSINRRS